MSKQIKSTPDSKRAEKLQAFDRMLTIMDELRENCPWDKKQTIESLRHLTIEEVYELSDAIIDDDLEEIKKELGDVMLHVLFYARIGSEKGAFDMADVLNQVADKLVRRHPHVYGDEEIKDEEAVKKNWEKIKLQEKGVQSVLEGVPSSLPALIKAMRIQEKVKGVGFDWEESSQVWEKVQEELQEFKNEIDVQGKNSIDPLKAQSEFGDLLFSLINYARFVDINPEEALERTNKKFIHRFQYLEDQARKIGKPLSDMTLMEMDVFWEEAKNIE
jgi:tetrapyrrole methylase family protein/MazG family protein